MIVIRPKHIALSIFLVIFSYVIFLINRSWGNPLFICIKLSVMTFLIVYLSFDVYWELRDFWQYRWYRSDDSFVTKKNYKVPLTTDKKHKKQSSFLYAEHIRASEFNKSSPLVIITHGFSDDRKQIRYYSYPLALAGFDVITYDCRGAGDSRKVGKRSDFPSIVKDLGDVIEYFISLPEFKEKDVYLLGFSMGAMVSLHYVSHPKVSKIIALSSVADYKRILPTSPITFKGKWWLWLRYSLFSVPFNPPPEINKLLSPSLSLKEATVKEKRKIRLIHALNDKIITYDHFIENIQTIKPEKEEILVTKKGGHNFMGYEVIILSKILSWFKEDEKETSNIGKSR